jgi:hypothetical protein
MKHDAMPAAHEDHGFEPEERPTRPNPPAPEHLRALRLGSEPPRPRVAARRRPALTPATQSWVATKAQGAPKTATSRWRAVAATVLGGGAGRQSLVDREELEAPAPPSRERSTPTIGDAAALPQQVAPRPPVSGDLGAGGTVRMPARRLHSETPAQDLDHSDSEAAAEARRALVRRWIVAVAASLLCATAAWAGLHPGQVARPATDLVTPAARTTPFAAPVAIATPLLATAATSTAEPAPSATPPIPTDAPMHPSPKRVSPRRLPPNVSSSIF